MPTVHLLIKGKVQGVFYRASAREKATGLKLTGWVKNTAEGNVEAVATGNETAIEEFITWCKKGPPSAIVNSIQTTSLEEEIFDDYRIIKE